MKVIIIGAGQHGQVAKNIVQLDKRLKFSGFLDNFHKPDSQSQVLGKIAEFPKWKKNNCYFYVAFGDNAKRKAIFTRLAKTGSRFASLVHPRAVIEPGVILGKSVFVGAGTYINVGSLIGDNVLINNGCIVEHDNQIGSHAQLAPGVITGGGAKIGQNAFLGLGAIIRDHVAVGTNATVGMGSVITKNVADNVVIYNKLTPIIK